MKINCDKNDSIDGHIVLRCNNINTFILYLIISSVTYGMFLKMHFSVDSYSIIYDGSGKQFLMLGRIITYIVNIFFNKLNINLLFNQQVFTACFIVYISLAGTILFSIINKYVYKITFMRWIIINVAILLSFINVFILEWALYPESTFFFGLGVFLTVIAIYIISKGDRIINIIGSFLVLMLAMNLYQAHLGIFIIYGLTICLIENKFELSKGAIKKSFLILLIGFFNSIFSVFTMQILVQLGITEKADRAPSITLEVIKNNITGIATAQKSIWNNAYNFLPKYSVTLFGIIIFGAFIYLLKKNRTCIKDNIYIVSIVLINYLIIFVPHLVTSTLWMAERTIVSFFSFLSSMIIIIFFKCEDDTKLLKILAVAASIFLLVNCIQIQNIGVNHIASNKLDQEYALIINNEILKYESANNIEVKYIATENDKQPTYHYANIEYAIYDTNIRAFITPWANINMINYFSGRNYIKKQMDQNIYEKYFKDKNWNNLCVNEQFVFVGDTLYLMLY